MTAEFSKHKKFGEFQRQNKISENDPKKIIANLNNGFNLDNHTGFLFTKPIAIEEHCESVNSLNHNKSNEINSKEIIENLNNGCLNKSNNVEYINIREKKRSEIKHEANKYNKSKIISNAALRNNKEFVSFLFVHIFFIV